jgi:hypothetical protein
MFYKEIGRASGICGVLAREKDYEQQNEGTGGIGGGVSCGGRCSRRRWVEAWLWGERYVSGTFCKGCFRTGPLSFGAGDGNRTHVYG